MSLGADVNAIDYEHSTPLSLLARGDPLATPKEVPTTTTTTPNGGGAGGAGGGGGVPVVDVSVADGMEVSGADSEKFIRLLLNKGANINGRPDCDGATPLHRAVEGKRLVAVSYLCKKGAAVNSRDNNGQSPLHYAAKVSLPLLPSPPCTKKGGRARINLIIQSGDAEIVKALLTDVPDIEGILPHPPPLLILPQHTSTHTPSKCHQLMHWMTIIALHYTKQFHGTTPPSSSY